jgi:hypothetical protein
MDVPWASFLAAKHVPQLKCAADCRKAQGKAQANDGADGMADQTGSLSSWSRQK